MFLCILGVILLLVCCLDSSILMPYSFVLLSGYILFASFMILIAGCDELLCNLCLLTSCSILLCLCHLRISELFYGISSSYERR